MATSTITQDHMTNAQRSEILLGLLKGTTDQHGISTLDLQGKLKARTGEILPLKKIKSLVTATHRVMQPRGRWYLRRPLPPAYKQDKEKKHLNSEEKTRILLDLLEGSNREHGIPILDLEERFHARTGEILPSQGIRRLLSTTKRVSEWHDRFSLLR